ncbi:MAG TPA: helix-turn-helix domain-containing protein [Flavobacteriaceae bacterium]|nr:helix-turn-helix domain-containing protein [Flavobacteriaceae bacterium]
MRKKSPTLLPKHQRILAAMGEQLKLARKRRKLTTQQVAERAGISRTTLSSIEKGDPSVAMGSYFNVLRTLNLEQDILKLAADDEFGQKLRDLELL